MFHLLPVLNFSTSIAFVSGQVYIIHQSRGRMFLSVGIQADTELDILFQGCVTETMCQSSEGPSESLGASV